MVVSISDGESKGDCEQGEGAGGGHEKDAHSYVPGLATSPAQK